MEDDEIQSVVGGSTKSKASSSNSSISSSSPGILSSKEKREKGAAKQLVARKAIQADKSAIKANKQRKKNKNKKEKNSATKNASASKTSSSEKGSSLKKRKTNPVAEDGVEDEFAPQARVRTPNFSAEENLCLATAWCSASENAVAGCCQKKEVFWQTVKVYFDSLFKDKPKEDRVLAHTRSWQSLWNKWTRNINPDVMLFLSYYTPYKQNTPSGWNEEKIKEESMKAYQDKEGTTFKYLNCLDVLKDHPKYNIDTSGAAAAAAEAGTNNTSIVMGGSLARPMGRKKAQKMNQNKNTPESCASSLANTKHSAVPTSSFVTAGSLVTAVADSIDRLNHTFILQGKKQETEVLMDSYLKSAEMYVKMGRPEEAEVYMNKWKQACEEKERKIQEKEDPSSYMFSTANVMLNGAMVATPDCPVPKTITTPTCNNNESESDDVFLDAHSTQLTTMSIKHKV